MFSKFTRIIVVLSIALMAVAAVAVNAEESRLGSSYAALGNVYQDYNGYSVWLWNPTTEQGEFQFAVDYDTVDVALVEAKLMGENILITETDTVSMWALSTGQLQVNSPSVDGGTYAFTF